MRSALSFGISVGRRVVLSTDVLLLLFQKRAKALVIGHIDSNGIPKAFTVIVVKNVSTLVDDHVIDHLVGILHQI